MLSGLILLALFVYGLWFALVGPKARDWPGPDAMTAAVPISEAEWRQRRIYRGVGLNPWPREQSAEISADSILRAQLDTKSLRLVRQSIPGAATQVLYTWPLSSLDGRPHYFRLSPDCRWALLVEGKEPAPTFTVHAVALDGAKRERKWTFHALYPGQYVNPFYPEWRSDSRAWRLWRDITPPTAVTGQGHIEPAQELVEVMLGAPSTRPHVVWRGIPSDYPWQLDFARDGTSVAVSSSGSPTRQVVFFRYKEPRVESALSRTPFLLPANTGYRFLVHPDGTKAAVVLTFAPEVKDNTELENLLPRTPDRNNHEHVVRRGGRELWIYDLITGRRTRLGRLPVLPEVAPGVLRDEELDWARDGKALLVRWTDNAPFSPKPTKSSRYYQLSIDSSGKAEVIR